MFDRTRLGEAAVDDDALVLSTLKEIVEGPPTPESIDMDLPALDLPSLAPAKQASPPGMASPCSRKSLVGS